jgi:hypothetical protein
MSKYNSIFFLLFILLVMGAFASMAQNSYGLKIMGGVAFIFGLVFIIELITLIRKKEEKQGWEIAELVGLIMLATIFGLRIFYIRFPFIELVFASAGTLLAFIYLRKMILRYRYFARRNGFLAKLVLVFHLSILLFLMSIAMLPYFPLTAEVTSAIAIVLLAIFFVIGATRKNLLVNGEKIPAFKMVRQLKDHSIIIISLFLLFSFYFVFNKAGLLPGIYSDEYPRAYFKLVDDASTKKEKPVDGRYRHEEFMEKYRQFIQHHKSDD